MTESAKLCLDKRYLFSSTLYVILSEKKVYKPYNLSSKEPRRGCGSRSQLKCDGTRTQNRFRLSAKRTSPFNSAGASVQSTTGSWSVSISGSNAGYTMFLASVKGTGYPLHSPVSPSLALPGVTVQLESTSVICHLAIHPFTMMRQNLGGHRCKD